MLKFLITFGLIYVVYRWVIVPNKRRELTEDDNDIREIEYTDYEELDD